ncbi:MAG: carbohydrate ABC transporter permease [Chloroflexota bacterium]
MNSRRLLYYVISPLIALLFALPLIWLVSSSLQQPGLAPQPKITLLPDPVVWSNYTHVFEVYPIGQQLLNSIFVVLLTVPLTLITASWAGFAMTQLAAPMRKRLVLLTVILLIVPLPALWLPRFVMFTYIGLIDTLWTLIIPAFMGSSPFFVLLFYWTFRRLPNELYEAARLDNASTLQIWRLVAMPLAKPTIAVVAVLTFVLYWSDFINPLIYLRSENLYTFSLRLYMFTSMDTTNQPLAMAATVIVIAPVVLLFLLVQRYFWPTGRLDGLSGR